MKYLEYLGLKLYDELIKLYIEAKSRITSTDKTVVVNDRDLSVNIDNSTLVKDDEGVISVDSSALIQYIGDKSIKINNQEENNIVSLQIDSEDQGLTQSNNGLKTNYKIKQVSNSILQTLGNNVKEAYQLVGINNIPITESDYIKIYKDSSLVSVKQLHSRLIDEYKSIVEVLENSSDQSFVGQQFIVKAIELDENPLELFTLDNNPTGISVIAQLFQEAVEAQEAILYTQEEIDEHNSELDIWQTGKTHEVTSTYTAQEAIDYNAQLPGAVSTEDIKTPAVEEDPDSAVYYTEEEAIQYNSELNGAVSEGDTYTKTIEYTQEEIDEHNALLDIWESGKVKVPAVEAQPAIYSFTSFETGNQENIYGTGKVSLISQETNTIEVKPTYSSTTGWIDIQNPQENEIALCFAYESSEGTIIIECIPIASFLRESEFKDGLTVNQNGEVSIKINPSSEEFLTVDFNGLKLSGISNKLESSKTTITEVSQDSEIPSTGAPKVIVTKETQSDGHNNYTIIGQDLASATKLSQEEIRSKSAETNIDSIIGLTKESDSENRTYINSGNYIGQQQTNTIKSDIKAIDNKLKEVDTTLNNLVPASYGSGDTIDPTKDIDVLFT